MSEQKIELIFGEDGSITIIPKTKKAMKIFMKFLYMSCSQLLNVMLHEEVKNVRKRSKNKRRKANSKT